MRQKLKKLGCYIIIIVLLPYVVTVFLNGPSITTYSHVDSTYIKVKSGKKEVKMPIEEYCIGILAKEIPASYDKEALKAQSMDVPGMEPKSLEMGIIRILRLWTARLISRIRNRYRR